MKEKLLETALTLYHVRYGCHGLDYHLAGVDPLAAPFDRVAEEGTEYAEFCYAEIKAFFSRPLSRPGGIA